MLALWTPCRDAIRPLGGIGSRMSTRKTKTVTTAGKTAD
jgi:hypothetical protein